MSGHDTGWVLWLLACFLCTKPYRPQDRSWIRELMGIRTIVFSLFQISADLFSFPCFFSSPLRFPYPSYHLLPLHKVISPPPPMITLHLNFPDSYPSPLILDPLSFLQGFPLVSLHTAFIPTAYLPITLLPPSPTGWLVGGKKYFCILYIPGNVLEFSLSTWRPCLYNWLYCPLCCVLLFVT